MPRVPPHPPAYCKEANDVEKVRDAIAKKKAEHEAIAMASARALYRSTVDKMIKNALAKCTLYEKDMDRCSAQEVVQVFTEGGFAALACDRCVVISLPPEVDKHHYE